MKEVVFVPEDVISRAEDLMSCSVVVTSWVCNIDLPVVFCVATVLGVEDVVGSVFDKVVGWVVVLAWVVEVVVKLLVVSSGLFAKNVVVLVAVEALLVILVRVMVDLVVDVVDAMTGKVVGWAVVVG